MPSPEPKAIQNTMRDAREALLYEFMRKAPHLMFTTPRADSGPSLQTKYEFEYVKEPTLECDAFLSSPSVSFSELQPTRRGLLAIVNYISHAPIAWERHSLTQAER
jgi:hypothetical protein